MADVATRQPAQVMAACPNPWCASHRRHETKDAYAPYLKLFTGGYYRVVCAVCPQIAPSNADPEKAIAAWNTRAALTRDAGGNAIPMGEVDWLKVARLAGEHGVRYRTNTALLKFLDAVAYTPKQPAGGDVGPVVGGARNDAKRTRQYSLSSFLLGGTICSLLTLLAQGH